jgi:hypothetical protein
MAAALLAVAYAGWRAASFDPYELALSPVAARVSVFDPEQASRWIADKTSIEVPVFALAGAKLVSAQHGGTWACLDFEVNGQTICLMMSRNTRVFHGCKAQSVGDVQMYCGKGVGWTRGPVAYYLRGGNEQLRMKLALAAARQCDGKKGGAQDGGSSRLRI